MIPSQTKKLFMQVGYGILLEGEVFNFMRSIELLLKHKYGLKKGTRQSPHITVKSPIDVENIEPYLNYLDELCEEIEEFTIQLNGFNSFGKKVIYIDVVENQSLEKIHRKILVDFSKKFGYMKHPLEGENITFHATLAYDDLDDVTFDSAFTELKSKYSPNFTFRAKKLGLFYKLTDDAGWVIVKKGNLNSNQ